MLRLYQGSNELAYNYNSYRNAELYYEVPGSPHSCEEYCLHMGCYSYYSCSATVEGTFYLSANIRRLVYYERNATVPVSIIPTLLIDGLVIAGFGNPDFPGGALYLDGIVNVSISRSSIVNSQAIEGGAVYFSSNTLPLVIKNCSFVDNNSTYGGGLYLGHNANFSVSDSQFDSCVALGGGGAIFMDSNIVGSITATEIRSCIAPSGGSIYLEDDNKLSLVHSVSENCSGVDFDAGIYVSTLSNEVSYFEVDLDDCTLTKPPTSQPTGQPSGQPSTVPTSIPTQPTGQPTSQPSTTPSSIPSSMPTIPTVSLYVTSPVDGNATSSDCYPSSTAACNLRSAWAACASISSMNRKCIINLEPNLASVFDVELGELLLNETNNIEIIGQNASVTMSGTDNVTEVDDGGVFPYTYSASSTNYARQNYLTGCVAACGGTTLKFSACNSSVNSNTYFRLYASSSSSSELAYNDNFCGSLSELEYLIPGKASDCDEYCLRMGCYYYYSCSATVEGSYIWGAGSPDAPQFIYYSRNPETAANIVPTFVMSGVALEGFGSEDYYGGFMSFSGSVRISLTNITMANGGGSSGGGVYVSQNTYPVEITDCVFQNLTARSYGGAVYVAYGVTNVMISGSTFSRCSSSRGGAVYVYGCSGSFCSLSLVNSAFELCTATSTKTGGGIHIGSLWDNLLVSNIDMVECGSSSGAIYVNEGGEGSTLTGLRVVDCYSTSSSAGCLNLVNAATATTISNVSFSGTTGNALYAYTVSDLQLFDVNITDTTGSGVYITYATNSSLHRVFVTTCSGNYAHGISVQVSTGVEMQLVSVQGCSSSSSGPGVRLDQISDMTISDVTVRDCQTYNSYGAGIYVGTWVSDVQMSDVLVDSCTGKYGGGLYFAGSGSNIGLRRINITNCAASSYGGGIAVAGSMVNFSLTDSSFARSSSGVGGGLYLASTTAVVSNVMFSGCSAPSSGVGGAVYVTTSTASFRNVLVESCSASKGGAFAVYSSSEVSLVDVTITDCSATKSGGGLYAYQNNDNLVVNSTVFARCEATGNGGGVYMDLNNDYSIFNNVSFTDCYAEGSTSGGPAGGGGGMFLYGCDYATIVGASFNNCTAPYAGGGGIYLYSGDDHTSISDSVFVDCATEQFGGGLAIGSSCDYTEIRNVNFSSCVASQGGALYSWDNSALMISDVLVENCVASQGYNMGGGFYLKDSSDVTATSVIFHNCVADKGGAVYYYIYSPLSGTNTMASFTITDCTASVEGGAVFVDIANSLTGNLFVELSGFDIRRCSAQFGGAVYIEESVINSVTSGWNIEDCAATVGGGAVYVNNAATLTLNNSVIRECSAPTGGAVYVGTNNPDVLVLNSTIAACRATVSGGAFYLYQNNDGCTLNNVQICDCLAPVGGGIAMSAENNQFTLVGSSVINCTATSTSGGYGGGLYAYQLNANLHIDQSTFEANSALKGGGLYIETNNYNTVFSGCTFRGNSAVKAGGGVFLSSNALNFAAIDSQGGGEILQLQTAHPYFSSGPVNRTLVVIFNQTVAVADAQAYVLNFDAQTVMAEGDVLTIYEDTTSRGVIGVYSGSVGLPGIDLPSIRIDLQSFIVEFVGGMNASQTSYNTYLYGFKLYTYPVIRSPSVPTRFIDNSAGTYGGGLYLFSAIPFPVVISSFFTSNKAVLGGGGLFLHFEAEGASLQAVVFEENIVDFDGGGLAMMADHYGIGVKNCTFRSNSAGSYGGAVMLYTGNGVGVFVDHNEILFQQSVFLNNNATAGGAVASDESNNITLDSCGMQNNVATKGSGGAVWLEHNCFLSAFSSQFISNQAAECGGAITSSDYSTMAVANSSFVGNVASESGGGVCLQAGTQLSFSSSTGFSDNYAPVGGGLVSSLAQLWEVAGDGTELMFANNSAVRGSAIAFKDIVSSSNTLGNITLYGNKASVGGTVYWLYDPASQNSAPAGLDDSSITWSENDAAYGSQVATQGIRLLGPSQYAVDVYGQNLVPALVFELRDYYDQTILLNGTTSVVASILNASAFSCGGRFPYLAGENLFGEGVVLRDGFAEFNALQAFCTPKGTLTVKFEARLGSEAGLPESVAGGYYVSNTTLFSFRDCQIGEYEHEGTCVTCPYGSYSLVSNVTAELICQDCIGVEGVSACWGDQIIVEPGYWRRYETSAAVLTCPQEQSGCSGGNMTGTALCKIGYEGPLCSVCAHGYYGAGGMCAPCTGGSSMLSVLAIALITIVTLAAIALGVFLYYRKKFKKKVALESEADADSSEGSVRDSTGSISSDTYRNAKTDAFMAMMQVFYKSQKWKKLADTVMTKLKIVVATFQITVATPTTMDIGFPVNITAFLQGLSFVNLNFASLVPLGCTAAYTFIDKLYLVTLFPVGIILLFFLCFTAEYMYHRRIIQRNWFRQSGAKASKYDELKGKYLNYSFYLSYLVLPAVTTIIFKMFLCTNVDPDGEDSSTADLFLTADMNISCTSPYYYRGVVYACLMIILYPVGIPLAYFVLLYRSREEIRTRVSVDGVPMRPAEAGAVDEAADEPATTANPMLADDGDIELSDIKTKHSIDEAITDPTAETETEIEANEPTKLSVSAANLAFLWKAYEPRYWYWEVIETTRRLMLTAALSAISPGSAPQAVLAVLLALMYIKLYGFFTPYESDSANILAEVGQYQILFTFFGGLVFQNGLIDSAWNQTIGILLTAINISVGYMFVHLHFVDMMNRREETSNKAETEKQWPRPSEIAPGT